MTNIDRTKKVNREALRIAQEIGPLLLKHDDEIHGAALLHLVTFWIVSLHSSEPSNTAAYRDDAINLFSEALRQSVPIMANIVKTRKPS